MRVLKVKVISLQCMVLSCGFVCFVLYYAKISGEHLQDHWSSGLFILSKSLDLVGCNARETKG